MSQRAYGFQTLKIGSNSPNVNLTIVVTVKMAFMAIVWHFQLDSDNEHDN